MDAEHDADESRTTGLGELIAFAAVLLSIEACFFGDALRPGWVLSAADWLLASESFREPGEDYEPTNRLLTDIACQMDPWLQLAGREWRAGRVPLWNPLAGCGAPLAANAQSGVFFPVNLVFFITNSPHGWVAAALLKLFIAGTGAYLLARELGLSRLGRWFAGLCFPFTGFPIVWLCYPMGGVAVWLPTLLLLVERLARQPDSQRVAWLGLVIGIVVLGGHPETAAHLLVVAALWLAWKCPWRSDAAGTRRLIASFAAACVVGLALGAVQLAPLAEYLHASQAWAERSNDVRGVLAWERPDVLAAPALGLPYVYGSYRRGHPHVEKALGVENFNEIAGGYAGLATLTLLVPLAWTARRRHRWIPFLFGLDGLCLAAVYQLPVADNLLRLIPVLNVTQNQRLLLVVALVHCVLGAAGLEQWSQAGWTIARRVRLFWVGSLVLVAIGLVAASVVIRQSEAMIAQRAASHFTKEAARRGLPPNVLASRAAHMARQVQQFFPRYYASVAIGVAGVGVLVWWRGRSDRASSWAALLIPLTVGDLFLFGRGYNPAIRRDQYPPDCSVVAFLRGEQAASPAPIRVLPLEEEFPPNVLGLYGIADLRNYDAIELRQHLEFFGGLWDDDGSAATSNAWASWTQVAAQLDRLRTANVRFLISTNEPQSLAGVTLAHRHGRVGVYEIAGSRFVSFIDDSRPDAAAGRVPGGATVRAYRPGYIELDVDLTGPPGRLVVAETWMLGWTASVDGAAAAVQPFENYFLSTPLRPGRHRVVLHYAPRSFRVGATISIIAAAVIVVLIPRASQRANRTATLDLARCPGGAWRAQSPPSWT
jgi:uncharacterized membrane protein YidH (DUF202 family)